jgi:conjugative transfer pilus assembly protein TraH
MGCGGIDAYLGGYSFVNKDAFVQALRNFGQAAVGYFFELALRSMAPEVAVTLDAINDIAQKVNQFGANSCKMAKFAVDSVAGKSFEENKREATAYAQSVGEYLDNFDAELNINAGGGNKVYSEKYMQKYGKSQATVTKDEVCEKGAVNVNVVYWTMCHAKVNMTIDEMELAMSMIGVPSIVVGLTSDDGTNKMPAASGYGATIDMKDLIGEMDAPASTLRVLRCVDPVECTSMYVDTQSGHKSFTALVQEAMAAITTGVTTRTAPVLTTQNATVLKLSSVPIARAAALAATSGLTASVAGDLVKDLAQYAALDAASNFMNYYLQQVDTAVRSSGTQLPSAVQDHHRDITQRIADLRTQLQAEQNRIFQKGSPFQKLDQLERIERAMLSSMSLQLAANQRFGSHR